MQITDGLSHNTARVDGSNRLQTFSINENVNDFSAKGGDSYNLATGLIALTGTAESSVLYLENTGTKDIVYTSIVMGVGARSATITDDAVFTIIRNPTGGDIVSNATALAGGNVNMNHGSSNTLDCLVYQGVDGGTITGGNDFGPFYVGTSSRVGVALTGRIPTGSSLGIKVDLNTSGGANVYAAINCHLHDDTQV